MQKSKITWSKTSLNQFAKAIKYIHKQSVQNAEKVRLDIVEKISSLSANPEFYPPDKYKKINDGSYRAFEIHHYRISYRILPSEIMIVRFRHVKRQAVKY
jgi:plasmid stabilization system protein ParE